MPGVSRDQIARAKEVNIEDYIMSHEPNNVKRIGRALYLKDHDSLEISNGLWNWHSHGVGGKNVIDYLIKVRGYEFVDAVRHLAGSEFSLRENAPSERRTLHPVPDEIPQDRAVKPKARLPAIERAVLKNESIRMGDKVKERSRDALKLPRRFENNNRVIEYLQNRGIDEKLIQECIHQNILFESADFHNAVFIGRDEKGKARFAAMRGTHGDFKRDADGSDKSYGFFIEPALPNAYSVAVFESPVDALSHKMLEPNFGGSRLSLGGTATAALTRFLESYPQIKSITICTDNDTAGEQAAKKIFNLADDYGIAAERSYPPIGKNWNESLLQAQNEVNILEDVRKDIRFIDSDYNELFRIKDGESIKITRRDGEEFVKPCRFIDEAHTRIGNDDYHICEFAERMEYNGNKYEAIAGNTPILHVIAAKYGEKLQDWGIAMTDEAIRKLVGGKYESEPLCGANGKDVFGVLLRGKDGIAVCGVGGDSNTPTSLHPYWAQKFKRELSPAERPAPEKADFIGKIDKFKAKAATQDTVVTNTRKLRDGLD
jgi:hypothetical protein